MRENGGRRLASRLPPTAPPVRLAFILNPAARNRRAGAARTELEQALAKRDLRATLVETEAPRHGTELARQLAADHDVVVAVGGDGTVHEVARGVMGTTAAMGVLPLGTGNDFAHALGMPDDLEAGLDLLLLAPQVPVDLARLRWTEEDGSQHEVVFVNCLGIGFDGVVAVAVPRYKWLGGKTAYLAAVLRSLVKWTQPDVTISAVTADAPTMDGVAAEETLYAGKFFLLDVNNGFSVGGGFLLTPEAVPDDGALDVCLVRSARMSRILRLLPTTFSGGHVGAPEVLMQRVTKLTLRTTTPIPAQADGEVLTASATLMEIEVLPGALRALAPAMRRPPAR